MIARRHLDIIALYAIGMTHKEIGSQLFIAPSTVMNRLAEARELLKAENSTHAVTICLARGLLCVDHRTERLYVPRPLDDHVVEHAVVLDD